MNLLNIFLQAQAGGNPSGGVMNIVFIIAIVAIFYFFMIRPQSKRQKEIKKFRESLKAGDQVITAGGIYGKIKEVKDDSIILTIADGVTIRISKDSVYQNATDTQQTK
ncbi:MAG: preprotein translocase subunit YajC [Bacteroidales bacterium]